MIFTSSSFFFCTMGEGRGVQMVWYMVTLLLKDQVMDSVQSMEAQMVVMTKSIFYQLTLILQLQLYLEAVDPASVIHALVTSIQDY